MKKTLLVFSVFLAVLCCTLALAADSQGKSSFPNSGQTNNDAIEIGSVKISDEQIDLAKAMVPATTSSSIKLKDASNLQEGTVDMWGTTEDIYSLSDGGVIDRESNTITIACGPDAKNYFFTGVRESRYYDWYTDSNLTYNFSGTLTSDCAVTVTPAILYRANNDSYNYLKKARITLDETNNYTSDFNLSAPAVTTGSILVVGYIVESCEQSGNITSTNNKFSYSYQALLAEPLTEENNLPGLGIEVGTENAYTLLCEDGITTLGLLLDGDNLHVTGINTTATTVIFPENLIINEELKHISTLGYNSSFDWSSATSITELQIIPATTVETGFEGSSITDLHIADNCNFNCDNTSFSNIYLHLPFTANRGDFSSLGFKRVLVGYEKPEYPEPEVSSWVIAGDVEGEYFGISIVGTYGYISVTEIFSSNESVTLPMGSPTAVGNYYIQGLGSEDNFGTGTLCKHAPSLKSLTASKYCAAIRVNWENNPITELHLQGDTPSTVWPLSSSMTVYVANKDFFSNYENNESWNLATLVPEGWEYDWMTVAVGRKGEFAQTYIEMTNADWSAGVYVKVTGELNETDLNNIKNLTNLRKLDLSGATFTELPQSFLANKTSIQEVILPENLTVIPYRAFDSCTKLAKVIAPRAKIINNAAFSYCQNLKEFDISNVTYLDNNAFYNCSLFNPSALSSELNYIGTSAFYGTGITEATIPEGVKLIAGSVFEKCSKLSKVTLHNSLTSIGSSAFNNCTNLVDIDLPEGLQYLNQSAFRNCSSLTEITLPSTLLSIGYSCFNNCTSLNTIKCKAVVPPTANGEFTFGIDLNKCTLYVPPFSIDAYRDAEYWSAFYIMKPLNEPVKNIFINRPISLDLQSEDNEVLKENPNITLSYGSVNYNTTIGQLSATGDGTLSAGVFTINHSMWQRQYGTSYMTTLVNDAENMRADNVLTSINFAKNDWHFISFPYDVPMADIVALYNTDYVIRQYNSERRATGDGTISNWEDVPADGTLTAGKGYILQAANNTLQDNGSANNAIIQFPSGNSVTKNRLFTSTDVEVALDEYPAEFAHNRSWNLVGNPYPCYYDIHYLMDGFTTPIVIWRGSSYQAYSPVDDDVILRPNEAFFVQRPIEVGEMVFGAEGRMHYDAANSSESTPGAKAPIRAIDNNRSVFNFNIEGNNTNDRTRIVMNENASLDYEIECDASKFFAETASGVEIYVDGAVKYDICERPLADGTAALGAKFATDGEYTLSLTGRNINGWSVMLTDTQTGITTDITKGSYKFIAKAGNNEGRFTIMFKAGSSSVTDIETAKENTPVRVVNASGITVFEGLINDFKAPSAGVYIVVGTENTYKIVAK